MKEKHEEKVLRNKENNHEDYGRVGKQYRD